MKLFAIPALLLAALVATPAQAKLKVFACEPEWASLVNELAGDKVEVSVTDRGSGIPAAGLERIFEPFVTTKSHGMGLGLSICRSIVEAHGGTVWATNNEDRGATLHCELPAGDRG